jgi:hypothetical protein
MSTFLITKIVDEMRFYVTDKGHTGLVMDKKFLPAQNVNELRNA